MSGDVRRNLGRIVAVLLAQGVLIGAYCYVEDDRSSAPMAPLGGGEPRTIDAPLPRLEVARRDGSREDVAPSGRPTLVHVWATWCPPCRAELPGLLALPSREAVDVVAIALDESWNEVDSFFSGSVPSSVVLAGSSAVADELDVRALPVTFVLDRNGRLTRRFDGPRDWTDRRFVRAHLSASREGD